MIAKEIYEDLISALDTNRDWYCGTGRTTQMIESLKDGDVVITYPEAEVQRLRSLMKRNAKVMCVRPDAHSVHEKLAGLEVPDRNWVHKDYICGGYFRSIHPDHHWVEMYFRNAIREANNVLLRFSIGKQDELPPVAIAERDHGPAES